MYIHTATVGSAPTPDHYAPQQKQQQGHLQGQIQSPCSIDDINVSNFCFLYLFICISEKHQS